MLTKEAVIKSMNDLPDKFSIDDLLERLIILQKIEIGLGQSKNGQTFSTEEVKEKLKEWLK